MRGAPASHHGSDRQEGIIPADAGSTSLKRLQEQLFEDHPRGCGEHLNQRFSYILSLGSSPRMRGALATAHIQSVPIRIIPADAGSTVVPDDIDIDD